MALALCASWVAPAHAADTAKVKGVFGIPIGTEPSELRIAVPGPGGAPGAFLRAPAAFRITPEGNLIVSDTVGGTVKRFDLLGGFLSSFENERRGTEVAPLRVPGDLAVSEGGATYVVDRATGRVHRFDILGHPNGLVPREDRADAERASVAPGIVRSIEVDGKGLLYVEYREPPGVRVFDAEGDQLGAHAGPIAGMAPAERAGVILLETQTEGQFTLSRYEPGRPAEPLYEFAFAGGTGVRLVGRDGLGKVYLTAIRAGATLPGSVHSLDAAGTLLEIARFEPLPVERQVEITRDGGVFVGRLDRVGKGRYAVVKEK